MADEKLTDFGFLKVPVEEKARRVAGVFQSVAGKYDLMNDIMSLGTHRMMKRYAVELTAARPGDVILDLAGGTGDLTILLSRVVTNTGRVILCDINDSMLERGRDRLIDKGVISNVDFVQADAEKLPFQDGLFDAITIAFGLRNVTDKPAALSSMLRTLKPGGRLVILEFSRPKNPAIKAAYEGYSSLWPKVGKTVTGDADSYRYLVESIRMHPGQEELRDMMSDAGFVDCNYHDLATGITAIHTGKRG